MSTSIQRKGSPRTWSIIAGFQQFPEMELP
jgi:hypothetical protein